MAHMLTKDFEIEGDQRTTFNSEATSLSASGSGKAPAYCEDLVSANDTVVIVKQGVKGVKVVCDIDHFYFVADSLALRRNINRRIDLEEMTNVNYVCAGSNSHIFSATWNNKNVIIKVTKYF